MSGSGKAPVQLWRDFGRERPLGVVVGHTVLLSERGTLPGIGKDPVKFWQDSGGGIVVGRLAEAEVEGFAYSLLTLQVVESLLLL